MSKKHRRARREEDLRVLISDVPEPLHASSFLSEIREASMPKTSSGFRVKAREDLLFPV